MKLAINLSNILLNLWLFYCDRLTKLIFFLRFFCEIWDFSMKFMILFYNLSTKLEINFCHYLMKFTIFYVVSWEMKFMIFSCECSKKFSINFCDFLMKFTIFFLLFLFLNLSFFPCMIDRFRDFFSQATDKICNFILRSFHEICN